MRSIPIIFILCVSLMANPTLINLPANSWYAAPNSRMQDVMYNGSLGNQSAIMTAWSGGAYDVRARR